MCLVAEELFRDACFSASTLRQDKSGHVRAQLAQCVFSAAADRAEVPASPNHLSNKVAVRATTSCASQMCRPLGN